MTARIAGGTLLALLFAGACFWLFGRAATPPRNVAYVTEEAGGIAVIDLDRLEVSKRVDLGEAKPRGLALTADGRYLLTANKETADVSVIDTRRLTTLKRIPIGTNPEFLKLDPGPGVVLTSYEPGASGGPPTEAARRNGALDPPSRIVAIDAKNWAVRQAFTGGTETEGIEVARDGGTVLMANESEDTISAFDLATGKKIRELDVKPYGARPRGIKISPDGTRFAVSMEGSGTLMLLDRDLRVLASTATGERPYGVAFDRPGRRILVACVGAGKLEVFDAASLKRIAEATVGRRCWHFTFTPDDTKILAACGRSDEVDVIDAATYRTVRVLKGIRSPWGVVTWPRSYGSLDLP